MYIQPRKRCWPMLLSEAQQWEGLWSPVGFSDPQLTSLFFFFYCIYPYGIDLYHNNPFSLCSATPCPLYLVTVASLRDKVSLGSSLAVCYETYPQELVSQLFTFPTVPYQNSPFSIGMGQSLAAEPRAKLPSCFKVWCYISDPSPKSDWLSVFRSEQSLSYLLAGCKTVERLSIPCSGPN